MSPLRLSRGGRRPERSAAGGMSARAGRFGHFKLPQPAAAIFFAFCSTDRIRSWMASTSHSSK